MRYAHAVMAALEAREMDNPSRESPSNIGSSLLGIILAVVIFVLVAYVGYIAFTLFDNLRGLGDDKLQSLFREVVCPGFAGYAAMYSVGKWVPKASVRVVFFTFLALTFVYVGFYIGFVGPIANEIGSSFWETILVVISMLAAIVGAYIYYNDQA